MNPEEVGAEIFESLLEEVGVAHSRAEVNMGRTGSKGERGRIYTYCI